MTRRAALGLLVLAAAQGAPRRAAAQAVPELRADIGVARVRQSGPDGTVVTDAAILGGFWRRPIDNALFLATANLTYGRDSLASAQGVAAVSLPWRKDERVRTEGGIGGAQFSLRNAGTGGNANGFLRQHLVTGAGGAWLGGAIGRTSRARRSAFTSSSDVGAWARARFVYLSGSFTRQESSDFLLLSASGAPSDPSAERFVIDDVEFVAEARGGPNSIALSWVRRRGIEGTGASQVAVSGSGVVRLTDRFTLTATAGRQLFDPLRGLPEADLITAGVRVSFGPQPLPVMQRSAIARAVVEARPGGGGELVIQVFAADSLQVEVAGDFSEWQPLPLRREEGFLVARVRLPPGKYRVAVRTGGGGWRAPRNLARVRDDYGGEAGLVVIP